MYRLALLALVGCGTSATPPTTGSAVGSGDLPHAGEATNPTATGSARGAVGSAGSGNGSGGIGNAFASAVDPRCGEECLFLADTPIEKLPEVFEKACGKPPVTTLFSNDCKQLDYLRNCIFAMRGMRFPKHKWKELTGKPWYHARPGFKPSELSSVEAGNVHALHQQGKACKKGVAVSAADKDRAFAWIRAAQAGKPAFPEVVVFNGERVKGDDMMSSLRTPFSIAKGTLTYDTPSSDITAALPDQKLHGISFDWEPKNCGHDMCDGVAFTLIYDEHDRLVAFEFAPP